MIEGPTLVTEALVHGATVTEIFVADGDLSPYPDLASALDDTDLDLRLYGCAAGVLTSVLDPKNPRPVAAVVEMPSSTGREQGDDRHLLAAVEVRDPGNLGTMIRTAEASGAAAMVVVGASVDPWNPKVVRASAGSILRLPVLTLTDLDELGQLAKSQDRPVLAAVISPKADLYDHYDLRHAILMLGNEPHGLSEAAVAMSDGLITIPLAEPVESLNVAGAAAVLCFEASRQYRKASRGLVTPK